MTPELSISYILFYILFNPRPTRSTIFPYTTLFRSANIDTRTFKLLCVRFGISRQNLRNGVREFVLGGDRKSTRLNSSHEWISYAVFCLKKKKVIDTKTQDRRETWRVLCYDCIR